MSKFSKENAEKSLECSICLNEFRKPKKLPCLHSFCLKCLQKYCQGTNSNDKRSCPLCRRNFDIPECGIEQIPNNELLMRLILEREFSDESHRLLKCGLCMAVDENVEATTFCMECRQDLCNRCRRVHTIQQATRLHKIVSIEEKPGDHELQRLMSNYCSIHNNEEIKLYCCYCELLICMLCHATSHYKHKCKELHAVAQKTRNTILRECGYIEECRDQWRETMAKLTNQKEHFLLQVSSTESAIKKSAAAIHNLTQACETEFLDKLLEIKNKRLKEIQSEKDLEELHYTELDSFLAYSRMVIKLGTDNDIIRASEEIHARVEELIESQDKYKEKLGVHTQRNLNYLQPYTPKIEDVRDLMGNIISTGDGSDSEVTDTQITKAYFTGDPSVVKSIFISLVDGLKLSSFDQAPDIASMLEDWLERSSCLKTAAIEPNQQNKVKLVMTEELLKNITVSTNGIVQELRSEKSKFQAALRTSNDKEIQENSELQKLQTDIEDLKTQLYAAHKALAATEDAKNVLFNDLDKSNTELRKLQVDGKNSTANLELEFLSCEDKEIEAKATTADVRKNLLDQEKRIEEEQKNAKQLSEKLFCAQKALKQLQQENDRNRVTLQKYFYKAFTSSNLRVASIQSSSSARGITVVDSEIYVVRDKPSQLNLYNFHSLKGPGALGIPDMKSPYDLAGCPYYKALYISDSGSKCIHRVDLPNAFVTHWKMTENHQPRGLSVTAEYTLLVTVQISGSAGKWGVVEFNSNGQQIREIILDGSIVWAWQTVKLSSTQFVVCHGGYSSLHRVCVINTEGQIIRSYGREAGKGEGRLNAPASLAIDDKSNHIFVADRNNHRILMLDTNLTYLGQVQTPSDLKLPFQLYFHSSTDRLFLSEYSSGRLLVVSPS